MKPPKYCLKSRKEGKELREYTRGGKLVQNAVHASIETLKWNPLV
jgi:hypothetical protein